MFHLFNKVYLSFDFALVDTSPWVLISQKRGSYTFTGSLAFSKVHADVSYSELLADKFNGQDQLFFDWLTSYDSNRELILYCDEDAFLQIFIKHIKALFPDITEATAYMMYRYTICKMQNINANKEPITAQMRSEYSDLVIMTEEDFFLEFDDVFGINDYSQATKFATSIEWLLASFLADVNTVYTQEFEDRLFKICWKQVAWEVDELKFNILSSIYDISNIFPTVTPISRIDSNTVSDIVAQEPKLAFINDSNCSPSNIGTIKAYGTPVFKEVLQAYHVTFTESDNFIYGLMDLLDSDTTTAKDLIDYDMSFTCGTQLLGKSEYMTSMNPYMVSYMYRLYKEGKISLINSFSLS